MPIVLSSASTTSASSRGAIPRAEPVLRCGPIGTDELPRRVTEDGLRRRRIRVERDLPAGGEQPGGDRPQPRHESVVQVERARHAERGLELDPREARRGLASRRCSLHRSTHGRLCRVRAPKCVQREDEHLRTHDERIDPHSGTQSTRREDRHGAERERQRRCEPQSADEIAPHGVDPAEVDSGVGSGESSLPSRSSSRTSSSASIASSFIVPSTS